MSAAKQRQTHRRQRRLNEIADAATQIVTANGIDGLTMQGLARAVDLTPGALYRYFDSREMILAAVELSAIEEFDAYFDAVGERVTEANPVAQVVAFALGYAALEQLRPERFRLISHFVSGHEQVLPDDVAAEIVAPTMRILQRFAEVLDSAVQANELRDDGDTLRRVAVTWSSLHGIMERRKLTRFAPDVFDPDTLAKSFVRAVLMGWGAASDPVDAAFVAYPLSFFETVLRETS